MLQAATHTLKSRGTDQNTSLFSWCGPNSVEVWIVLRGSIPKAPKYFEKLKIPDPQITAKLRTFLRVFMGRPRGIYGVSTPTDFFTGCPRTKTQFWGLWLFSIISVQKKIWKLLKKLTCRTAGLWIELDLYPSLLTLLGKGGVAIQKVPLNACSRQCTLVLP